MVNKVMKENRKLNRAKKYFSINIIADDLRGKYRQSEPKSNPKFCDEAGLDFSPQGIKIMCSKPIPEESKIKMKMFIPDAGNVNMIKANGDIKWLKKVVGKHRQYFTMGICFSSLDDDGRNKLLKLWNKYK